MSAQEGNLTFLKNLHTSYKNIDINKKNSNDNTALILSAKNGHLDCVKYLVKQGADKTLEGQANKTALEWAVAAEKQAVAAYLSTSILDKFWNYIQK